MTEHQELQLSKDFWAWLRRANHYRREIHLTSHMQIEASKST